MRILEINKYFYPKGGSEVYLFGVRQLLKEHGHEVMDFSMHDPANGPSAQSAYFIKPISFAQSGKLSWLPILGHLFYSTEAARQLDLLIKEQGRPDVAHLQNISYELTPSIIRVLKKHKIPIVWTLHDFKSVDPLYYKPGSPCSEKSKAKRFIIWLEFFLHTKITKLYFQADIYICPSKFLAELAEKSGFPKDRIRQLYNFMDLKQMQPRREFQNHFLFVGRLIKEKGINLLLEVFKKLPEQNLVVIGSGEMEGQLNSLANDHKNITYLGAQYPPVLYEEIAKAKALIMPSICLENNPLVILEAMALGVPVIGSNQGGIPELIEEGRTGLIFDPSIEGDLEAKINDLNNYNLAEMGRAARRKAEEIADRERHYEKLIKIFEEVMNQKDNSDLPR